MNVDIFWMWMGEIFFKHVLLLNVFCRIACAYSFEKLEIGYNLIILLHYWIYNYM